MKKSLSLLTLSLLLVVAMILGVSANITEDDIGAYIRFDSQAAVDTYCVDRNDYVRIAFDAEHSALRLTTTVPEESALDANAYLSFGGDINLSDYPYFRMVYMIPSVGVNGMAVAEKDGGNGIHFRPNNSYQYRTFAGSPRDTKLVYIQDLSEFAGQTMNQIRTDFPNNAQIGCYYEYYIYEIALFKTKEAANGYNPGLEYYVYDMTSPTEYEKWSTTQSTMTYNAELGATVFTHDKYIKAEQEDPSKNADARVQLKENVTHTWYSVQDYPVVAWYYKTNQAAVPYYILDTHKTDAGVTSLTEGILKNAPDFANATEFEDGWKLGYVDAADQTAGLSTIARHVIDPLNINEATGEEYVAFKYIAYFKNAEQAAKGVTYEPENLAVVPATSADGKATITGVDSTMEYTNDLVTGIYTAVEGDTIAADPGKTYYVRYAETETANASNSVAVGVPHYFDLKINSVKNSKGEAIDAAINYTDDGIVIDVPFGTNARALMLSWSMETSASANRTAASLYLNGDSNENKTAIFSTVAMDFTAATKENGMTLVLYYNKALCEYVNLKINVEGADKTDAELAQLILEAVSADAVSEYALLGAANASDAHDALYEAAEIANFIENFAGAEIDINVTAFTAATKGTAADIDGTDGSATFEYTVAYGEVTVDSEPVTLNVPAQHFRYLWKFNDQEFADAWFLSASNVVKTEKGEIPIVTENGETFARVELTGANNDGIYLTYNVADPHAIYNGAAYNSHFRAEDYPYTLIYYRSNGDLPKVDSTTGAMHIYFTTSDIAKGNHYDYAPVKEGKEPNPSDPKNFNPAIHTGGSYLGYQWARYYGYWNVSNTVVPTDTKTWNTTIINNNGDTAGVSYAASGYGDENNYVVSKVQYPWTGDVTEYRFDVLKVGTVTEGTVDIMAIAFFSSLEDAQNFDLSVINPMTASEKAAVDAWTIDDADGALVSGEEAVFANAKAKAEAQFADFDSVTVEKVSYTAMDAANGTNGSVTVKVTVVKGTQLGDRETYTATKTMTVVAPAYTVAAAAEAIEALYIKDIAGLYTEAAAETYALNAIAGVVEAYPSYIFNIIDATYVAPVDGTSDGSYTFYVQISDGENETVTAELSFAITMTIAPYVMNFDNEVIVTNALLPLGYYHENTLIKDYVDIDTGKGLYIERTTEHSEFNFSIVPGRNGMGTIEELSDYSVIAYRYKLSNGDPTKSLQVYYYTDLYENGHAYQQESISQDGTDISDKWVTRYFTVRNPGFNATGTCENTTWGGLLEEIRFDFMRQSSEIGASAAIDYIGLFANMNQAQAYMADPYKNGSEEALAEYDDVLAQVNALEAELPAVDMIAYDTNDDNTVVNWKEIDAIINDYIASLELGVDAYYAITEFTTGVCGTEKEPEAIDGVVKFKIAFADGGVQNGYVVTSKEFTMELLADPYVAPVEGETVDGVIYGADAETGKATIVGIEDAESVVIPATVIIGEEEYAVTSIAADAFAGMTAKEVRLPNTINEAVEITGYDGYVFVQPKTATAAKVTGDCVKFKGDYNDDTETAVGDVIGVLQSIAAGNFTDYQKMACDVVKSGTTDVSDAIRLLQWIAVNTIVLD